jgi:hypothetical protein
MKKTNLMLCTVDVLYNIWLASSLVKCLPTKQAAGVRTPGETCLSLVDLLEDVESSGQVPS